MGLQIAAVRNASLIASALGEQGHVIIQALP
jgi:hypothetical protein